MDRKLKNEVNSLVRIGIPEDLAYIFASDKHNINKEEVEIILEDMKEQQIELKNELNNFIRLEENIKMIENEKNINLISNLSINDKNENKII